MRAYQVASLKIPDVDDTIVPTTGEPVPTGTHLEALNCSLMRPALPYALPALPVPPAQHLIAAATDQGRASRIPGHRIHDSRMPRQDTHTLPARHLPHEHLPAISLPLAPSARGEPLSITAPGHVVHFDLMPREVLDRSPVRGVPHRDAAIITGTRQPRSVWTPRHSSDPGRR